MSETYSIEHPYTIVDDIKLNNSGGLKVMLKTWTNLLQEAIDESSGQVIWDGDTALNGRDESILIPYRLNQVE